jgi:hypothetical protein
MAWRLEGTDFETCSCEVVCPCTASFAPGASYDRRGVTLVFDVTDGDVEGTDVSGPAVAAVADPPKVMSEGRGRLRDRGRRAVRGRVGRAGAGHRHLPPGRIGAVDLGATRSSISAFGTEYEARAGFSTSPFAWAA